MNSYIATVIKTGNSTALRVPKQYAVLAKLVPGEKVHLKLPSKQKQQDYHKIKQIIENLQKIHAYKTIKNPVLWQREIRKDRAVYKKTHDSV